MALKLSRMPALLWMLKLSSVTQRKFPLYGPSCPAPACCRPHPPCGQADGLISSPTWLCAALPLPWPGCTLGLSVLVCSNSSSNSGSYCFPLVSASLDLWGGQKVLRRVKGPILEFSPHRSSAGHRQGLKSLSSKPVILVLRQGVEEQREL